MAYFHASPQRHHAYLWPALLGALQGRTGRLLDLGCGGGSTANMLASQGWEVVGVDPFADAINNATAAFPACRFQLGSAADDLSALGSFDAVISMEVVEHLPRPSQWARTIRSAVKPGGICVVSTPYHGWLKNVAIAAAGHWDQHHAPLYERGHIKFWSRQTLTELLHGCGLRVESFIGAGRLPLLWKSMVLTARRA